MTNSTFSHVAHWQIALNQVTSLQHRSALIFILLMGIGLRIYAWYAGQGYHYFAINDELVAYRYALAFLAGEAHAQYLGQPAFAVGQAPGPLWTLFWVALLKLAQGSVHHAIFWMGLFNSLAIYIVYRLARQMVTPNLALLSALFFALAPWPIYYSIGLWNPLPLVVLGGLLFLALWQVLNTSQSKAIFWVCVLAAIVPQFHMIGVFYIPAILLLLYLSNHTIHKYWFGLGIIIGISLYMPYFIYDYQQDFANTKNMLSGTGDGFSFSVLKVLTAPLTVLSSLPARWAGRRFEDTEIYADHWFGSIIVLLVFGITSLIYALTVYIHLYKRAYQLFKQYGLRFKIAFTEQPVTVFLSIIIFLPLLLFLLTGHNFATRYLLLVFPVLFLLPALFYQSLAGDKAKKRFLFFSTAVTAFNIYLVLSFFTHQGNTLTHSDTFSPSFAKLAEIHQTLTQHVGQGNKIHIIISDEIDSLPQGYRKLAYALTDYVDIMDTYYPSKISPSTMQSIRMQLVAKLSKQEQQQVIYQQNGMAFLPVE